MNLEFNNNFTASRLALTALMHERGWICMGLPSS
jgi:hypothetical protein